MLLPLPLPREHAAEFLRGLVLGQAEAARRRLHARQVEAWLHMRFDQIEAGTLSAPVTDLDVVPVREPKVDHPEK